MPVTVILTKVASFLETPHIHICIHLARLNYASPPAIFILNTRSWIVIIRPTNRVLVEGKSSVCVICMKYRILFVIIIIISLGQTIISYMTNTSRAHAGMHTHTHTNTHAHMNTPTAIVGLVVAYRWVGVRPTITKLKPPVLLFRWR